MSSSEPNAAAVVADSLDFSRLAQGVAHIARAGGITPPVFASPPANGTDRAIRRRPGRTPVVLVRFKGRAAADVVADLVAGVAATAELDAADAAALADSCNAELFSAMSR